MSSTQYYGTGRRKSSVARVFLRPGEGKIVVNKQPIDTYFNRESLKLILRQPLETVEVTGDEPTGVLLPPTASGGITLVSRSPVLRQRSTFGAQTQTRLGWRYRANQTGVARLAAMSLTVGGRTYTTDPITIDVVQGSSRGALL